MIGYEITCVWSFPRLREVHWERGLDLETPEMHDDKRKPKKLSDDVNLFLSQFYF